MLNSFREKVYPEDQDPVHRGDGYPNEQQCAVKLRKETNVHKKQPFWLHLGWHE